MNADGSDERKLLATNAWSPAWSPDGMTIAFVSDQDGDDEIYTVDADGQNTTKLTDNQGIADDAPSWSPDSTMIAFTSNRAGDGNIFTMRTNGSGVHTLVGAASGQTATPPGTPNLTLLGPRKRSRSRASWPERGAPPAAAGGRRPSSRYRRR